VLADASLVQQASVREQEPLLALEPLALQPRAGALVQREAQQEPVLVPMACVKPPWPQLPWPNAPLPRRFPHPLHLADGA
jgi:hypothetical protein